MLFLCFHVQLLLDLKQIAIKKGIPKRCHNNKQNWGRYWSWKIEFQFSCIQDFWYRRFRERCGEGSGQQEEVDLLSRRCGFCTQQLFNNSLGTSLQETSNNEKVWKGVLTFLAIDKIKGSEVE